ncbi:uncharacterized protein LOC129953416 [Eupeodes corollae]|uniref:uncharacterized protein LOC129953416 n=1 Tax=Eupeodes corollae TaxID=290404 RepID=UPI002490FE8D|nr:uncharacterized protein LOC129953416 [Eupeodes corollae]
MVVKSNDNMLGGSKKRPPRSSTAASPLRSLSSSATTASKVLGITEQRSQYLLSRTFLRSPFPPPPTTSTTPPTTTKAPIITKLFPLTRAAATLPCIAVSTTITSKLVSEPLVSRIVSSSLPTTATQSTTINARSAEQISAVTASSLLSGRTKLLQQRSSHQQIQQQQQYHHLHHHHHTPQFRFRILPGLKATSFFTILTLVCLETVLLSTVSNCAKTFYMHWNTSNSIFRIDNTDHIIDVNKGNLAFEFDQVHIICPVYEPGTFENETEKYIIYNVSKVEYETCRITNADPRVIAICDKPQRLMFFTITFRPFTPQPGGLEFLPGNDYYFISTSSKDDLYRRIGGRCSTNNMKVVFKVCCAPEDKNNRTNGNMGGGNGSSGGGGGGGGIGNNGVNSGNSGNINSNTAIQQQQHNNNININGVGQLPLPKLPVMGGGAINGGNGGLMINGNSGTSINTNIDQYNNRKPSQQPNNIGNGNMGMNGIGIGGGGGMNGINGQHPTGIRINNVPSSQQHPSQKNGMHGGFIAPMANINTNSSNVVQSTINWPDWGNHNNHNGDQDGSDPGALNNTSISTIGIHPHFYPPHKTSPRPSNINSVAVNNSDSNYSPSHKPTKNTNDYDKHPNEVVKNEELTYNSAAPSLYKIRRRRIVEQQHQLPNESGTTKPLIATARSSSGKYSLRFKTKTSSKSVYQKFKSLLQILLFTSNHRNRINTINTFMNFVSDCNPIILTTTVLVTLINLFQYKFSSSWSVMRLCNSSSSTSSKVPPPTRTSSNKLAPKFSSLSPPKNILFSPADCCIMEKALR